MTIKLDMSKAYDILEWDFIIEVLNSMGFPVSMFNLIRKCITSISYQVLVNGQPNKSFFP